MPAKCLAKTQDLPREEWLELRKRGLGGSDVLACAGLSKWKSPFALYLEKRGELLDDHENEAMYWGKVLEEPVAQKFAQETGYKIRRCNKILQHPTHTFALANLDREIIGVKEEDGPGILEIKTTGEWMRDNWEGDELPYAPQLQLQHYFLVTGYRWGYIAILIGGQTYKHFRVQRDEEIINYLIEIESAFWNRVLLGNPPPVDGSEATTEALRLLYPRAIPRKEIQLSVSAEGFIRDFHLAHTEEKKWKDRKDEASNALRQMLEDAEIGCLGTTKVRWTNTTTNRLDTTRLKAELPEIHSRFCKELQTRRFTIK